MPWEHADLGFSSPYFNFPPGLMAFGLWVRRVVRLGTVKLCLGCILLVFAWGCWCLSLGRDAGMFDSPSAGMLVRGTHPCVGMLVPLTVPQAGMLGLVPMWGYQYLSLCGHSGTLTVPSCGCWYPSPCGG